MMFFCCYFTWKGVFIETWLYLKENSFFNAQKCITFIFMYNFSKFIFKSFLDDIKIG